MQVKYMLHAVRMLFKSALQYRASLMMQVIAQFVMTGGEMLAVVVLLSRFQVVGHWGAGEIMFFFGVMQSTFALTELLGRGITSFAGFVQRGDFDALILRPRPLLVQVMVSQLDPRRMGGVLVGVIAMLMFQIIANVGMCLFIMPVIGLTLPFFSYGGSSIVMLFVAMGLVSGVHGRSAPDWLKGA